MKQSVNDLILLDGKALLIGWAKEPKEKGSEGVPGGGLCNLCLIVDMYILGSVLHPFNVYSMNIFEYTPEYNAQMMSLRPLLPLAIHTI